MRLNFVHLYRIRSCGVSYFPICNSQLRLDHLPLNCFTPVPCTPNQRRHRCTQVLESCTNFLDFSKISGQLLNRLLRFRFKHISTFSFWKHSSFFFLSMCNWIKWYRRSKWYSICTMSPQWQLSLASAKNICKQSIISSCDRCWVYTICHSKFQNILSDR